MHQDNLDGAGESSDQEGSGISSESHTTSCTSSRDSSESPEHSLQSSSQSNESDNTHSDSSTLEESPSGTLRRRLPTRQTTDIHDSRYNSTADTSYTRVDSASSGSENTCKIGLVSSATSGQLDDSQVEVSARRGRGVSLPYTGVVTFNQHRPVAVGTGGGTGLGGVGHGSFNSLQQRKEEMLKKARQ